MNLADLTREDFAGRVGSSWRVPGDPGFELTLVDVSPCHVSGPWETFALLLRGPAASPLDQGTYALDDVELGRLELFLVPLGPDDQGPRYECVFTRATSATTVAGG